MTTKVCSKCGEEKDESEFRVLRNACRKCEAQYTSMWRKNNRDKYLDYKKKYNKEHPEKNRETVKRWRIKYPDRKRESDKLWKSKNQDKVKQYAHTNYVRYRPTIRERHLKYYYKNKPRLIELSRLWYKTERGKHNRDKKNHRRRCLSKQTPCTLTLQQWEKILETQGNKCAICGKRFCKSRPPTKDHIIPLSKGGGLTFENVQALCRSCNSSKNASLDHSKIVTWCTA